MLLLTPTPDFICNAITDKTKQKKEQKNKTKQKKTKQKNKERKKKRKKENAVLSTDFLSLVPETGDEFSLSERVLDLKKIFKFFFMGKKKKEKKTFSSFLL